MKTNCVKYVVVAIGLMLATPVFAATTAVFSPATVSATAGQKFDIVISVNPQGIANFAEKVEVVYPAEILEVASFTPAATWMALAQPGYDSLDNAKGVLVKTAGYPGGFASTTPFGTVSFHAKKAGMGAIKLGAGGRAFDANGEVPLTGEGEVAVTVRAATPAAPASAAPQVQAGTIPTPIPQGLEGKAPGEVREGTAASAEDIEAERAAGLEAAAGEALPEGERARWPWIALALALFALAGYGVWRSFSEKKN